MKKDYWKKDYRQLENMLLSLLADGAIMIERPCPKCGFPKDAPIETIRPEGVKTFNDLLLEELARQMESNGFVLMSKEDYIELSANANLGLRRKEATEKMNKQAGANEIKSNERSNVK